MNEPNVAMIPCNWRPFGPALHISYQPHVPHCPLVPQVSVPGSSWPVVAEK
jgi:hypothetical protein